MVTNGVIKWDFSDQLFCMFIFFFMMLLSKIFISVQRYFCVLLLQILFFSSVCFV